jgi:histidyl-tRNA synthetase
VRISDRRFLSALAAASGVPAEAQDGFFITLDKLDKIGWERVRAEFTASGLTAETIERAVDTITGLADQPADKLADALASAIPGIPSELVADLSATAAALDRLSAQRPVSWQFDPTLVRGMGYYTGHIFEVSRPDVPFSLAGGGRYDGVVGKWLGRDVPAAGFSIGFERIIDLVAPQPPAGERIALLHAGDADVASLLTMRARLQTTGADVTLVRAPRKPSAMFFAGLVEQGLTHVADFPEGRVRPLSG